MGNALDFDMSILEFSETGEFDRVVYCVARGKNVNQRDFYRNTALHRASCMGHVKIVSFLIENGADVNAQAKDGWTPLHLAAKWGRISIIRILIEAGADSQLKTNEMKTAYDLFQVNPESEEAKHISQLLMYKLKRPSSPLSEPGFCIGCLGV